MINQHYRLRNIHRSIEQHRCPKILDKPIELHHNLLYPRDMDRIHLSHKDMAHTLYIEDFPVHSPVVQKHNNLETHNLHLPRLVRSLADCMCIYS